MNLKTLAPVLCLVDEYEKHLELFSKCHCLSILFVNVMMSCAAFCSGTCVVSVAAVDQDEVPRLLTGKLMVVSKPDIIGLTGDTVTKCVSRLGAKQSLQQWSCSLCEGTATFHSEDSFRYCRIVFVSCRTCCRQCPCMHNVQAASDSQNALTETTTWSNMLAQNAVLA